MKKSHLIALCVFMLLAAGCGKEQTISTPGGDVKITQKGNTATFSMNDKGEKVNVVAGTGGNSVALPDKFPADVPIMPGATVKMAMSAGENLSVHLGLSASQADAVKYYQDNLKAKGWEVEAAMTMGEMTMLSAKKGGRECAVQVAKDGGGTIVMLVVPAEKS